MIKYSVIIPLYKDRKTQFKISLGSYVNQTYDMNQVEFIIIDQGNDENVEELYTQHKLRIKNIRVDLNKVEYNGGQNPSYAQNVGFKHAQGEYIVLTSPEVVFENQTFQKFDQKINPNIMLYCTVAEVKTLDTNKVFDHNYLVNQKSGNWLCHPRSRPLPMAYFMAVINKQVIFDVNGVDEDFMQGIAYEDDDFGRRLHTKVKPVYDLTIFGAHLHHSRNYQHGDGMPKVWKNAEIYNKKKNQTPYPVIANQNRIWGNQNGIVDITSYYNGSILG